MTKEIGMNTFRNLTPRLSTEELIRRTEARERRERCIGACILVGTVLVMMVLAGHLWGAM
jgi:hypothetical protein